MRAGSIISSILLSVALLGGGAMAAAPVAPGSWTTGTFAGGVSLLLTDGSILQQVSFSSNQWQRVLPGTNGHYDWAHPVAVASMHETRGFFPTVVMKDGRVFVAGGEYGSGPRNAEVYDPVTNAWTALTIDSAFYDCSAANLPDGRVLTLPNGGLTHGLIYNPVSNAWTTTSENTFTFNETGIVQLAGGAFLAISQTSYPATAKYLSASNQWVAAASAPTGTAAFDNGGEGTKVQLYDGRVLAIGQTGHSAYYTPGALASDLGTWTSGPTLPDNSKQQDAFSVVMANGHVLLSADQGGHNGPTRFYDFDPATETFVDVSPFPINSYSDPYMPLLLPTGEVLVSGLGIYTPSAGGPQNAWKPTISSISDLGSGKYRVTGTQLNGLTDGATYGDDAQMSTNYPLLRFVSGGGAITYARTFNFSTLAIRTGATPVTADFTLPSLADGTYSVQVVTNGIASATKSMQIQSGHLVIGPLPSVTITSPPATATSSPISVSGTASGSAVITQVTWSNAATGESGTATGTTTWVATIPLAAGSNLITITVTDNSGATNSSSFTVVYTPPGSPGEPSGGGGGHGGGCGLTGLEALVFLALAALQRRSAGQKTSSDFTKDSR